MAQHPTEYSYCNENNGNPIYRRNDNNSVIIIIDASLAKNPFDLLPWNPSEAELVPCWEVGNVSWEENVAFVVMTVVLADGSGVLDEAAEVASSDCPFRLVPFFAVWFAPKNDVLDVIFEVVRNSWQLGAVLSLQCCSLGSPWSVHCFSNLSLPSPQQTEHGRQWESRLMVTTFW